MNSAQQDEGVARGPLTAMSAVGEQRFRFAAWRSSARLNALSNYLNLIVLALLNLVFTPVLIGALGTASFGVWKACLRFLDLTTVADGRGTQALKWVSAFRGGTVDNDAQHRLVGAAVAVWLLWVPLLLAVLAGIVYAIPVMIEGLDATEAEAARWTAGILALNVLLAGLLGIPDAVLIGANRGWKSMNLNTTFLAVSNVGFVIAAHADCGIISLAAITLAASAGNALLTWLVARRSVDWWGVRWPKHADVRALAGFSGWTLMWMLAQAVFVSGELFLFSWLIGAVAVAGYSVTSYATQSGLAICMLTVSAKIPGLARTVGDGRDEEAAAAVLRCRELAMAGAAVIGGVTLLLNRSFVGLWAGNAFYLGDLVNALIVLTFFQLVALRCDAQLQDATLKIKLRGIAGLAAAVGSLATGWAAFRFSGRIELAYVALILTRVPLHFVFANALGRRVTGTRMPWRLLAVGITVLAAGSAIGPLIVLTSWLGLLAAGAVLTGVIAMAVMLSLTPSTRSALIGRWA